MPSRVILAKAVRSNRIYARVVGWADRFDQIVAVLGFHNMTPGEEQFALAVGEWQRAHPPLKPDGMLGPNTWRKMEPETRFTPSYHVPVKPPWLNDTLPDRDHPNTRDVSTNIWFGLGINYGGHFFAIGRNAGHAWLVSADDYKKQFVMTHENWRLGPGLGGSWGLALVMIASLDHPTRMNSAVSSGWDVTIGLGARWKEVIEKVQHAPTVKRLVDRLSASDDVARIASNPATKRLLKIPMEDWMSMKGRIKELVSATGMKTDSLTPTMTTIGVPVPYSALELSGYWEFGSFRVEDYWGVQNPANQRGL